MSHGIDFVDGLKCLVFSDINVPTQPVSTCSCVSKCLSLSDHNTSQTMLKQAVSVLLDDSVGRCLQGAWNVDMSG